MHSPVCGELVLRPPATNIDVGVCKMLAKLEENEVEGCNEDAYRVPYRKRSIP
jgi:hypothetical protein